MIFAFVATVMAQNTVKEKGVIINGVCWATRNVGKPNKFAEKPESAGELYRWNRKIAYSAVGDSVENWDDIRPEGDEWETANDPSPRGWRIPTMTEFASLLDADKVKSEWITRNGIAGLIFTDLETGNILFIPAIGFRIHIDKGKLYDKNLYGHYWSSEQSDMIYAYGLHFGKTRIDYYYYDLYKMDGRSIRPVAE